MELMGKEIEKVRDYINKIRPWSELNERETLDRIMVMRALDNIENEETTTINNLESQIDNYEQEISELREELDYEVLKNDIKSDKK